MDTIPDNMSWGQIQWLKILDYTDHDPMKLRIIGGLLTSLTFFLMAGLLLIVDYTGRPKWAMKLRIQPEAKDYPLSNQAVLKLFKISGPNMFVTAFVFGVVGGYIDQLRGVNRVHPELPSILNIILTIPILWLAREVAWYYTHRILHHPMLYKRFHKLHHTWTSPVGFAAIYCTVTEHVVSNLFPIELGLQITGCHMLIMWAWTSWSHYTGVLVHCGFKIPSVVGVDVHDLHHEKFNYNYGSGFLDWVHGTGPFVRNMFNKVMNAKYGLDRDEKSKTG